MIALPVCAVRRAPALPPVAYGESRVSSLTPPPRYPDGLAAAGLGLDKMSDSIPALNNQLATLDGKNSIRNSC